MAWHGSRQPTRAAWGSASAPDSAKMDWSLGLYLRQGWGGWHGRSRYGAVHLRPCSLAIFACHVVACGQFKECRCTWKHVACPACAQPGAGCTLPRHPRPAPPHLPAGPHVGVQRHSQALHLALLGRCSSARGGRAASRHCHYTVQTPFRPPFPMPCHHPPHLGTTGV